MRAVVLTGYGGVDKLEVRNVVDSQAERGAIVVRMAAGRVNPIDWVIRSGAAKDRFPVRVTIIPGRDVAGEVMEVGADAKLDTARLPFAGLGETHRAKRRLFALVACAVGMTAAGRAGATDGTRLTGFGPVQDSMGGVGVGATLDAACIISNPAGLADLGARVDGAISWLQPNVSYRATESQLPPGFTGAVVAHPSATIDSNRGGSPLPFLAGVFPMLPKLNVGVAITGISGAGVDYPANLYGGPTTTSYLEARLAPSVAYRMTDIIAFGLTLNVMLAQLKYDVATGLGQQPHDTSTSPGLGATIGVKITPMKALSIGVAYETKSWFQDFSFGIPAHLGVNSATFQPTPTIPAGTDKLTFDQPQMVTLGVAVTPIPPLFVAADVEWINWAATQGLNLPAYSSNPQTTGALPFNLDWSDQWVFKLGAQVTPLPKLRVRAGYTYGKNPLNPTRAFENIAFPAIAEHHITAGAGYDLLDRLTINIAGMISPTATLSGSNAAYPAEGGQAVASYTTQLTQWAIDLGVSWRF
ncbi:MAG: outer membrane protein transport protein [Polyangiaceae bacterium]|jgi:long-chain fatty acid transport protein